MAKINPEFSKEIKKIGGFDLNACVNCGNCTAICPLSDEDNSFPRKMVRATVLGLEDKITGSLDPWLCYYCGECSDTCPKEADPGALMMALRRYMIRKYSFGRIADLFMGSLSSIYTWIVITIGLVSLVFLNANFSPDMKNIKPLSFISLNFLHDVGIAIIIFVGFFTISNVYIMIRNVKEFNVKKAGIKKMTVNFFKTLISDVFLHKDFKKCDNRSRYLSHFCLFLGFMGLLLATILAFGIDFLLSPESNLKILPKVIGIFSGIPLLYGSIYFLIQRLFVRDNYSKYSHQTDWMFLILMFLAGLTGFVIDVFKTLDMFWSYYIFFAVHIVIALELMIIFPFTKFSHAVYRPLAAWMSKLIRDSK